MKACLKCQNRFSRDSWECPNCGYAPHSRDGHLCFAPEIAELNDGYDPKVFEKCAKIEPHYFWFSVRNKIIIDTIRSKFMQAKNMLEIGCGTGFVLSGIRQALPEIELWGSEIYLEGLAFAEKRAEGAKLFQMDARRIPFTEEFDLIGAFDVLEHIEEDTEVLSQIYKALKPGGGAIVTVPQHRFLWSGVDDYACHKRRYTRSELNEKARLAGFDFAYATSFISFLLPLMMLSRKKRQEERIDAEFSINRTLNKMLESICNFERALIKSGISFPAGGSLLAVLRKPA